jgi:hypothetical protein
VIADSAKKTNESVVLACCGTDATCHALPADDLIFANDKIIHGRISCAR